MVSPSCPWPCGQRHVQQLASCQHLKLPRFRPFSFSGVWAARGIRPSQSCPTEAYRRVNEAVAPPLPWPTAWRTPRCWFGSRGHVLSVPHSWAPCICTGHGRRMLRTRPCSNVAIKMVPITHQCTTSPANPRPMQEPLCAWTRTAGRRPLLPRISIAASTIDCYYPAHLASKVLCPCCHQQAPLHTVCTHLEPRQTCLTGSGGHAAQPTSCHKGRLGAAARGWGADDP